MIILGTISIVLGLLWGLLCIGAITMSPTGTSHPYAKETLNMIYYGIIPIVIGICLIISKIIIKLLTNKDRLFDEQKKDSLDL